MVTTYQKWVEDQGVPVVTGFSVPSVGSSVRSPLLSIVIDTESPSLSFDAVTQCFGRETMYVEPPVFCSFLVSMEMAPFAVIVLLNSSSPY